MLKWIVILLVHLVLTSTLWCQEVLPRQRVLSVDDGLSSNGTDLFLMDRSGTMWMSGGAGLDKFDGVRTMNFTVENGGLESNAILRLAEDFEGNIWLLTKRTTATNLFDIQIFDPNTRESKWVSDFSYQSLEIQEPIVDILNDQWRDELWIVTQKSVYIYSQGRSLKKVYDSDGTIGQIIACSSGLWMEETSGFSLLNLDGNIERQFKHPENGSYKFLGTDSKSNLYHFQVNDPEGTDLSRVFKNDSLFVVNGKYIWDQTPFIAINSKRDYIVTREGEFYLLTDLNQNEIARVKPEMDFYKFPFSFYFDIYDNWWLHFDKGVHVFNYSKPLFENYLSDFFLFGENGFNARGLINLNDTTLLVSGLGGTYLVDTRTHKSTEFLVPDELVKGSLLNKFRRLDAQKIDEDNIMLSTEGGLIFNYDLRQKEFKRIYSEQIRFSKNGGVEYEEIEMNWSLMKYDNTVFIGQSRGLSFFSIGDTVYKKYKAYNEFVEVSKTSVYDIFEKDKRLWLGTEIGLYEIIPGQGVVKKGNLTSDGGLLNETVLHINSFNDSTLYLATHSGVIEYHINDDRVINIWNETTGLSDNTCYAVYQDETERLWVPTDNGINLINAKNGQITVFRKSDGISENEFNTISHTQDENGILYFGNLNGVTRVDPKDFYFNSDVTGLFLSSLRFQQADDGKFIASNEEVSAVDEISMTPKSIGMELKFGLRDYLNPSLNSFSYLLEGLDDDWTFLSKPDIRINRLPYGSYVLHVRAQGSYGTTYAPKKITINVLRPFYLTWWFGICVLVFLIVLILALIKYRESLLKDRQKQLESEIDIATREIRKQAQELKSLDQLKSNFFANISHELKTPLSLILAPLEAIIGEDNLAVNARTNLQLALRNTETIKNLINEILDLSRLENGVTQPTYSQVSINAYFRNLIFNFGPKAESQAVRLSYSSDFQDEKNWVLDTSMTEKIINNLLSNALKFTPGDGDIEVEIRDKEGLTITVKDTGVGISDEDLPHIFDRFFQTKDPTRKTDGGTGIGLALSYELASVMNGDLSVESKRYEGSIFSLWLPYISEGEMKFTSVNSCELEAYPTINFTHKRILLVEDNEGLSTFIKLNLKEQFEVTACKDGLDALAYLNGDRKHKIDLIISDMMMPNLDGLSLLKQLKSHEDLSQIPVIFLTARSAERDKMEAFRLGVDDYLLKPFSLAELKARIKNQLKIHQLRKFEQEKGEVGNTKADELSMEEQWLTRVRKVTEENIASVEFNIGLLAQKMGESERTFYRKLKSTTGYSPNIYIKEIRLQMARSFLEKGKFQDLAQVAQAIGFTSSEYFSRQYKERFGKLPSEYFRYTT